ncbi:MAG TPA: ribulose-phosphate 3-epimerase [Clostridia bacterium]|nr:ribulose-phosphate 3-epimerase [Clostridia bacterium]
MIKVAPSILSADFADMGREVERVEAWGADYVHFDVMDGSFVSAITFGPAMCKAVRKHTSLPLDVHLMVEHPQTHIEQFRDAGADILTFHAEAERHIHRTLQSIRLAGMKAGVVLNPASPICLIEHVLDLCDMVLLMSVNPGAGGQSFIPETLKKIKDLRTMANERGLTLDIEVDGGINPETARLCIDAGANVLVAGNSVFTAKNPTAMVKAIREGKF